MRIGAGLAPGSLLASCFLWAHAANAQTEQSRPPAEPGTIIVTGTRIVRTDQESASPTRTADAGDFVLAGVPNVEQTLNRLPQLVGAFTSTSNNPGTGAATLDLRGLGSVRTLVLVNGRRWIASDGGQVPEVDVNTIPAALIERVDIVTGGGSAVYGSDAVTGVINFILRSELDGIAADARSGISGSGDARVTSADLSFGQRMAGGRLNLMASVGWLRQEPVLQGDRALSAVSLADGCVVPGTRQPNGASTAVNDPACAAPNRMGLIAGGSAFIPGTRILGRAFFPAGGGDALTSSAPGLRFTSDGRPVPFVAALDSYNFAPFNYLQVPLERVSMNLIASYAISPLFEPHLEFTYVRTDSPQQLAPVAGLLGQGSASVPTARINLTNPFLSADARRVLDLSYGIDGQGRRGFIGSPAAGFRPNPAFGGDADGVIALPLILQTRLDLGPRRQHNRRDAWRLLAGVRGAIGGNWEYGAYYSRSRVEHDVGYVNGGSAARLQQALLAVRDPVTGRPVCIDRSNGCVPANIFGEGNLSPEASAFIRTNPSDTTEVGEEVAEASLRGDIPMFATGPAGIAIGATWRRTSYAFAPDAALFTGDELGFLPGKPAAGSTRLWELFAEARVPLLRRSPLADALTLELGARWSHHDTVGAVGTFKTLAEWAPWPALRLRGGYQRAVRAPNVRELFEAPLTSAASGAFDPCTAMSGLLGRAAIATACLRNGVPAASLGSDLIGAPVADTRGDVRLEAETARTFTLGAVLRLDDPAITLSIDYYDIRIADAIGLYGGGPGFVVAGCIFAGADPADPLCRAFARDANGAIASYDLPTANIASIRARGLDWQLALRAGLGGAGRLDLDFSGTHYFENSFRANSGVPAINCAGYFGGVCGNTIRGTATPAWKLYNSLSWTRQTMQLTLGHRWFSATRDSRVALRAAFGQPAPALPEEGEWLEARHYLDLAVTFRIDPGFSMTLGASNLTDQRSPVTGSLQVQANTDPSLYDVIGRRLFVVLSVRFR